MSNTFTNVAGLKIASKVNASNIVDYIIAWESGELDPTDVVLFFQYLIDTGQAWSLQGSYGRAAQALIDNGHCFRANDLNRPGVIDASVIEAKALPAGVSNE